MATSQLVLMLLSFAGMFAFAGVALWLWLRQRRAPPVPASQVAAAARTSPATAPKPAPAPEPEPEVTEFVALPGRREDDSPQPHLRGHEGASPVDVAVDAAEEPVEGTEFIPAPLELAAHRQGVGEERTEFMQVHHGSGAPMGPSTGADDEDRTAFVAPPEPPGPGERTAFVAPPPAPVPGEPTTFVAPPPAPVPGEPTTFVAPPEPLAPELGERSSFEAPPAPELPVAPPPVSSPAPPAPPPPHVEPEPKPVPHASAPIAAELREHFELAVAALAQLEQREDEDLTTALRGHLEVLASAPLDPLLELSRPAIEAPDPTGSRCHTAWLALLQHKSWPARRALPELIAGLDEGARAEGLRALASWDDPRAPGLAVAGLEQAPAEHRHEWLELFAERGWDPGEAAVVDALRSSDPKLLIIGLRLAGARESGQIQAEVSAQVFATDPAVRIEAIETSLVFAGQSAWLVCRQLARNPAFPRAAELVGLLGSMAEITALCQVASAANSAALLWGLGLSGRPEALQSCATTLDDDELRPAARAALALACGREFDSTASAQAWLGQAPASARLIGGEPRTLDAIARALSNSDSIPLRQAIARELQIRSGGRVALAATLRPQAHRRQLDDLRRLELDLDRDFPWHG
ncbi:MAG: hypothetical protein R6X02_03880 [Enhygromyxa sp.]